MSVGGWVAFTLYLGAAHNDADLVQRALLQTRLEPHLVRMKDKDPNVWRPAALRCLEIVGEVMGKEWRPSGEFTSAIENMLEE